MAETAWGVMGAASGAELKPETEAVVIPKPLLSSSWAPSRNKLLHGVQAGRWCRALVPGAGAGR
jgi:hypothetical protein